MNALSPIVLADAIEWRPAPARRNERWPVALSTVLHGALIVTALILLHPEPQMADIAGSSVEVELIAMETVSSNAAPTQSDAAADRISAGGEIITPAMSETVEAIEPAVETTVASAAEPVVAETVTAPGPTVMPTVEAEPVQPKAAAAPEATPTEMAEPVAAGEVVPLLATTAASIAPEDMVVAPVEAVKPATMEALEPVAEPTPNAPPIPHPRTSRQKPVETPDRKPPVKPAPKQPQQAGNGGNSNADARASAPSGGPKATAQAGNGAAVTKYPGQVLSKLRRALRYPQGGRGTGEVSVRFTVSAAGSASGVRVVKSSGNPVFDKAAMDTVRRAAPFPPIPRAAGRNSWTFTMPLGFVR